MFYILTLLSAGFSPYLHFTNCLFQTIRSPWDQNVISAVFTVAPMTFSFQRVLMVYLSQWTRVVDPMLI